MERDDIVVSVVMITYGHEKYIEEAINGVFMQQTDFSVELIIANDCSPDNTDEVVKNLIANAPANVTVIYIRHESNVGMMPNFISAVQQTKGKYIALCEGDDYWTDSLKLQKQVGFLERNEDFFGCQHFRKVVYNDNSFKEETYKSLIFTQCVVFRNILDSRFTESLRNSSILNTDSFLFEYILCNGRFEYMDFFGSVYRITGDGVFTSLDYKTKMLEGLKSYLHIARFIENSNYKYKNERLKVLKLFLSEKYFLLAYKNIDHFTIKQYVNFLYSERVFNILEIKRLGKLILQKFK